MLNRKKKKKQMEENQKSEVQEQGEAKETKVGSTEPDQVKDSNGDSPETNENLAQELEKLKAEVDEYKNKHLRLYAEFDNFKRRTSKERLDLLQTAGKDVVVDLLPVLDDFERATKSMETATDIDAVKEGIKLVHQKLKNILAQKGLAEMESIGKEFDADVHEGITSAPAPSEELKGKVLDELEKGYYLNDKVIRFAKVIIGA